MRHVDHDDCHLPNEVSRRAIIGSGFLLSLASCAPTVTAPMSQPAATAEAEGNNLGDRVNLPGNASLSPQVVYGNTSARSYTEVALSLHCGATREYLQGNFRQRLAEARAGQRMLIITHYVRTENEIPLGETLLRRGSRYPASLMAMVGLNTSIGRSISASEADAFLANAGFPLDAAIRPQDARLALGLARVSYDGAGLRQTPFIREGVVS